MFNFTCVDCKRECEAPDERFVAQHEVEDKIEYKCDDCWWQDVEKDIEEFDRNDIEENEELNKTKNMLNKFGGN